VPGDRGDEALFDVGPVGVPEPKVKRAVDKTFRRFDPGQGFLLPPSLDDWLPQEHLARFIAELVDEHLDLSRISAGYTEGRGAPPYDPRLMVRVLLYGYTTGVRSSRALEKACIEDVATRWLAAGAAPDYRAIARFRRRHLSALGHLFVQALVLCQAAGMVKLGRVALDGTKLRANASRRKAMSYARMSEKEKVLAQEVSDLLADAEQIDKEEDAQFGKHRRGDELPAELRRRESRLAKITEAKAALEAEAAQAAAEAAQKRSRERGEDADTAKGRADAAAAKAAPKPKAQRNFTDPDSRIMKTSDGSFHQCYNAQAVVDAEHQVIIAAEVNQCASDVANLIPMTEQATANTGGAPGQVLADAGYCSADNLEQANEYTDQHGSEFFIATGRRGHDEPAPVAPRGAIPKTATGKQRMARKLTTKRGKTAYARRKVIVEPVFGQMSTLQNAKHLLLRGIDGAHGEWLLLAACHNLRKLHAHLGITGLQALATS
jgi:transposase